MPDPQALAAALMGPDQAAMQPETFANPAVRQMLAGALTLPKRAIENSQNSLNTGTYDPGPTLEAATLPMGTGAIAGVPVRAGEAVLGAGPIRAYHGSPHDFDAFSLDKIGTGEGAQAYGHGLYFAENPQVADMYSRVVTSNKPGWQGTMPPAFDALPPAELAKIPDDMRGRLVASWQNNGEDVAKNLARKLFEESRGTPYSDALHTLAHGTEWKPPGHRYEVNINADPEHFLDWDKPLSEQHPSVQQTFAHESPETVGSEAYHKLQNALIENKIMPGADPSAKLQTLQAQYIRDAGIPGIKYLDQGSRAAGDGSRNYVVFNDKLIDILKKYGIAAAAAPSLAQHLMDANEQ